MPPRCPGEGPGSAAARGHVWPFSRPSSPQRVRRPRQRSGAAWPPCALHEGRRRGPYRPEWSRSPLRDCRRRAVLQSPHSAPDPFGFPGHQLPHGLAGAACSFRGQGRSRHQLLKAGNQGGVTVAVEGLQDGAAASGGRGIKFVVDSLGRWSEDQRVGFAGQELPEPVVDHFRIPRRTEHLGEPPQLCPHISHGAGVEELLPCCQHRPQPAGAHPHLMD